MYHGKNEKQGQRTYIRREMIYGSLAFLFDVVIVEVRLFLCYYYFPVDCQLDKNIITSGKSMNRGESVKYKAQKKVKIIIILRMLSVDGNLGTFGHVGGTDDQLKIISHVFSIS